MSPLVPSVPGQGVPMVKVNSFPLTSGSGTSFSAHSHVLVTDTTCVRSGGFPVTILTPPSTQERAAVFHVRTPLLGRLEGRVGLGRK